MPVNICVIGSGSKGNCTAVWNENTILLIDAGKLAVRYIRSTLTEAGLKPADVEGVLITHCHTDHINDTTCGLCGPEKIPVYCSRATWEAALKKRSNRRLEKLEKLKLVRNLPQEEFRVGDFTVKPFKVSHAHRFSADMPVGYTLKADGIKVAYATDLGYVTPSIEKELAGSDVLVIESNHDVQMERESGRHKDTIEWVLGKTGHLSNEQCAKALGNVVAMERQQPKHVVLAHLSQDCNLPELAVTTSRKILDESGVSHVNLLTAYQKRPTPVLTVEL